MINMTITVYFYFLVPKAANAEQSMTNRYAQGKHSCMTSAEDIVTFHYQTHNPIAKVWAPQT